MTNKNRSGAIPSSFRDPSGFLFQKKDGIYRQVNVSYKEDYDRLMQSGLYELLVDAGLLIPHNEVAEAGKIPGKAYKVIKPEMIPFISYPYEWCFSQLKDAALATIEIQKKALEFDMSLKDSSAYNIQFRRGRPVMIDTLSFERYREGAPWVAYRQYCQHFLAPLALMSHTDVRLNQLLRIFIDGVPLDLASSLLPARTRFNASLLSHIHLHAKSQARFAGDAVPARAPKVGRLSLLALIENLGNATRKLTWESDETEWANYYEDTNYSDEALNDKKRLVATFLEVTKPNIVWDLGANTGLYSRLASDMGVQTIAFDIDPGSVERNYQESLNKKETHLLPLLLDLTNPSSGIGWQNQERQSLFERGPADTALALALIHHLAISNNLPFDRITNFFSEICESLIIEFIPKGDSQVQRLLASREDIFPDYTQDAFESEFGKVFKLDKRAEISGSDRSLYLMRRK